MYSINKFLLLKQLIQFTPRQLISGYYHDDMHQKCLYSIRKLWFIYNFLFYLNQMGNCAGAKNNSPADNRASNPKQNSELKKVADTVQSAHKQLPPQLQPVPEVKNQKEERVSDEYPAIDSLQIESAKKEIPKDLVHDIIHESEKRGSKLAKEATSAIKQRAHEHQFTFQDNTGEDEVVADENVGSFKNNYVNINFQIRAS